jgi:agmatinase
MVSFLESELSSDYNSAKCVIFPIPYEKTTSYHKGTKHGPKALLTASNQLEIFDTELNQEISNVGIFTAPEWNHIYKEDVKNFLQITKRVKGYIVDEKWPLCLGGEHSITPSIIEAFAEEKKATFGIVHLDAHFDLRESYEGSKNSHACALKRSRDFISETLSVGIRAFSKEEFDFAQNNNISFITDKMLYENNFDLNKALAKLPANIYLSIDLDFFSPAEIPGVGTPVPGGPLWWDGLKIIKTIFQNKNVIGMDIVELCPEVESFRSPFLAAMLAYKCIGYKFFL